MADGVLREYASVTLNGSGAGTAKVGPLSAREVWQPSSAYVGASTHTKEATCTLYVGPEASAPYQVDATFAGSSGDTSGRVAGRQVTTGQYVWAVWSGGDAGATATLTVIGAKTI